MNKLSRDEKIIYDVGMLFAELKTYGTELFDDTCKKIVEVLSTPDSDERNAKISETMAQADVVQHKLDENRWEICAGEKGLGDCKGCPHYYYCDILQEARDE